MTDEGAMRMLWEMLGEAKPHEIRLDEDGVAYCRNPKCPAFTRSYDRPSVKCRHAKEAAKAVKQGAVIE